MNSSRSWRGRWRPSGGNWWAPESHKDPTHRARRRQEKHRRGDSGHWAQGKVALGHPLPYEGGRNPLAVWSHSMEVYHNSPCTCDNHSVGSVYCGQLHKGVAFYVYNYYMCIHVSGFCIQCNLALLSPSNIHSTRRHCLLTDTHIMFHVVCLIKYVYI